MASPKKSSASLVPLERIQQAIYLIRGEKVMLDEDLAKLYGVETRALNQAVRRHRNRFPSDFMFEVTAAEFANLKSQSVTSRWGGRRKLPLAFTEQGVAMLSSVLNGERAVEVNILIMRAFVRLRNLIAMDAALRKRVAALERGHSEHRQALAVLFSKLEELELIDAPEDEPSKHRIGFRANKERGVQAKRR